MLSALCRCIHAKHCCGHLDTVQDAAGIKLRAPLQALQGTAQRVHSQHALSNNAERHIHRAASWLYNRHTSRAALLLTRSVVVMATAACRASSALLPRVAASVGTASTSASIFSGRPMTPATSAHASHTGSICFWAPFGCKLACRQNETATELKPIEQAANKGKPAAMKCNCLPGG